MPSSKGQTTIGGTYAADSSWNQMQTSHIALYVDPIKLPVRIPMHKRTGASDFRTTVTCSREYILRCASFFPFFSGAGIISTLFRPQSRAVTHMAETSNRTGVSALHIHLRLRGIATLGNVMYCTYSRYMYSAGSNHCDPEVRRVSEVGPRGRLLATIPPMLETESGIFPSNKYYRSIPVILA